MSTKENFEADMREKFRVMKDKCSSWNTLFAYGKQDCTNAEIDFMISWKKYSQSLHEENKSKKMFSTVEEMN